MNEKASLDNAQGPGRLTGKRLWCAAIAGAVAALFGVFAYCVYHAHAHLHEDACSCAKYGAVIIAAFSHPIALIGALAGICLFSAAYAIRCLYRHIFQGPRGSQGDKDPHSQ